MDTCAAHWTPPLKRRASYRLADWWHNQIDVTPEPVTDIPAIIREHKVFISTGRHYQWLNEQRLELRRAIAREKNQLARMVCAFESERGPACAFQSVRGQTNSFRAEPTFLNDRFSSSFSAYSFSFDLFDGLDWNWNLAVCGLPSDDHARTLALVHRLATGTEKTDSDPQPIDLRTHALIEKAQRLRRFREAVISISRQIRATAVAAFWTLILRPPDIVSRQLPWFLTHGCHPPHLDMPAAS